MAQFIPRSTGPQVQQQLGPQARNTAQVDLSPLARTAGAVGGAAMSLFEQARERADMTAVMQARRELSDWEGQTFRPDNPDGIAKYQGKDALQAPDALLGGLDQRIGQIRDRLSPAQRAKFEQVAFSFRDTIQGRLNNHADREYSAYEATERKAALDNIGQDAVSAGVSGDFGLADVRIQEALGMARAAFQTQGLGEEAIKASERGIVSSTRKQTIAGLATRDPYAAEGYYHRYADQMSPEDRAQTERLLYPVVSDRNAYDMAQDIVAGQPASEVAVAAAPPARGRPSAAVVSAIDAAAAAEGLDAAGRADLYALAEQESGFNPRAVNSEVLDDGDRATGLFQYRATSAGGIDRTDAVASARRAAREYRERLAKGGRAYAIAAHFAGEGGADAVVNRGRSAENPKTALYIRQVMGRSARWSAESGQPAVAAAGTPPATLAEAVAAIPRSLPPDQRAKTEGYLRDFYAQRKAQAEQVQQQAAMSIYDKVTAAGAGVPLSRVLGPAELALVGRDASLAESINRYRKLLSEGAVIEDDPVTVDELQRMQALRPSDFAKVPLGQYADRLSGKTLKAFADDQARANDPGKRADWMSADDRLNRGFQMLGIGASTDARGSGSESKNAPRAALRGEFRIAYQNAQTEFMQIQGKKPTPEQADALLRTVAQQFSTRLVNGELPGKRDEKGEIVKNKGVTSGIYSRGSEFELQASQEDRDAFASAFRREHGREPTNSEVTRGLVKQVAARRAGKGGSNG